jgi:hypothetical protein
LVGAANKIFFGRANKTKFLNPYHAFYCAGIEGVGTDRQQFGISSFAMPIFAHFLFFIVFPNFDRQRHERLCDTAIINSGWAEFHGDFSAEKCTPTADGVKRRRAG